MVRVVSDRRRYYDTSMPTAMTEFGPGVRRPVSAGGSQSGGSSRTGKERRAPLVVWPELAIAQAPGGIAARQPRVTKVPSPWTGHQPEACVPVRAPAMRAGRGGLSGILMQSCKPLKRIGFHVRNLNSQCPVSRRMPPDVDVVRAVAVSNAGLAGGWSPSVRKHPAAPDRHSRFQPHCGNSAVPEARAPRR